MGYFSFFQFHQGVQQILQVFLTVEFQFKTSLALAIDNFDSTAKMLGQAFFTFCYIVHLENCFCFLCYRFLLQVFSKCFRLPDGQVQGCDLLCGFHLFFGILEG